MLLEHGPEFRPWPLREGVLSRQHESLVGAGLQQLQLFVLFDQGEVHAVADGALGVPLVTVQKQR